MPPLGEIITVLSPVFYFHKCPITYFPSPQAGEGNFDRQEKTDLFKIRVDFLWGILQGKVEQDHIGCGSILL